MTKGYLHEALYQAQAADPVPALAVCSPGFPEYTVKDYHEGGRCICVRWRFFFPVDTLVSFHVRKRRSTDSRVGDGVGTATHKFSL